MLVDSMADSFAVMTVDSMMVDFMIKLMIDSKAVMMVDLMAVMIIDSVDNFNFIYYYVINQSVLYLVAINDFMLSYLCISCLT